VPVEAEVPVVALERVLVRLRGREDRILNAIRLGMQLPPITVWTRARRIEVADGNHRLWAYRTLGIPSIRVRFLNMSARWWQRELGVRF
jgi:hypothetical protein